MSNAAFPVLLGVVVIDDSNKTIRVVENSVTSDLTIALGDKFLRGDGSADDLLEAVRATIQSHTGANTYTASMSVDVSPSGVSATITITRATGANDFQIQWAASQTTFDEGLLGFTNANTANNGSPKTSTLSPSCIWAGNDIYRSLEVVAGYRRKVTRAISGKTRAVLRSGDYRDRFWEQEYIEERRMHEEAISADPTRALSRFIERHGDGRRFEFHDGAISSGTTLAALTTSTRVGTFVFDDDFYPDDGRSFATRVDGAPLYSFSGRLMPYVA